MAILSVMNHEVDSSTVLNRSRHQLSLLTPLIQEAKYVERWPNTTSAWAGWSRFDIPVVRYEYGGELSLLICTAVYWGLLPATGGASQQENTYSTKYQKADRASTLVTL